jgi:GDPmannose 4,6-dehydratase
VVATGDCRSVREFCEAAFEEAGMPVEWRGEGAREEGVCRKTGVVRVAVDPRYFRPAEVDLLQGDASLAREVLGWKPATTFAQLVSMMVSSDLETTRCLVEGIGRSGLSIAEHRED